MKPKTGAWVKVAAFMPQNQTAWQHRLISLTVIYSRSIGANKEEWHHISVSRSNQLPSWGDLNKVRNDFLGEDVEAYHVLAKISDHVNLHKYCMHIWAPLDGKRRVLNLQDITMEYAE